ncbi:MAG: nucleoside phosphorylase [Clostridia bacterium]|nr:nucleoside phosphorylase [Clostridia bacterium]
MILEEFDDSQVALFNAFDHYPKVEGFPKTVVAFFSYVLMEEFERVYKPETIMVLKSCSMDLPIYKINSNGIEIAVMHAPLGGPYIVEIFEEIISFGAKNVIICGSCGSLTTFDEHSIIIPTSAIRDEGTSYHYAPASDEIELNKEVIEVIEGTLKEIGVHYTKGKTWTTDAIYRETAKKVERRKAQGAIVVEMECASMTAFSQFRGINFGQLLYTADDLSTDEHDVRGLLNGDVSKKALVIPIALRCAANIQKYFKNKAEQAGK